MMGCFKLIFGVKKKSKIHSDLVKNDVYENDEKTHTENGAKPASKSLTDIDLYNKKESEGAFKTRRITFGGKTASEVAKLTQYDYEIQEKTKRCSTDYSKSYLNTKVNSEMLLAGTIGSSIGSYHSTKLLTTIADDKKAVEEDIYSNFDFPFHNLVFEGGGNKGMAYVGALQVLEEAGITRKIKRVAGSSVGAITASLIAVGFSAGELKEFMETDLRKVLVDHKCGYCSLLPNLLSGFGWNPGKKLNKWFGEQLKERTGNADVTFREVLQKFDRELCVVVTNLSQMSTEYFHPKTTPNTPIRTAVRMSTALPGVFQSVRYRLNDENTDVYVDGGLLCNYPIHAYDGWWLSMDPQDSFFKKLQPLDNYAKLFAKNERFGSWNHQSIGIMLYSHTETELMKAKLAQRLGNEPPPPPNSKLYRKRRKMRLRQAAATQEHQAVVSAVGRFMKELHRLQFDLDGIVSLKELKKVFEVSTEFTLEDQHLLFGNADINDAFRELDRDNDGEITFQELMSFVEKKGVNIQTRFLGYTRREIKSLGDFISTLQTALAINVKRNYVEDRDIERTIGIDTDYIEANDFLLDEMDKGFLLESGARAARAFLRHFCKKHPEYRRRSSAMLSKRFFDSPRFRKKFEDLATSHPNNAPDRSRHNHGKNNNSLNVDYLAPGEVQAEVHYHKATSLASSSTPPSSPLNNRRDSEISEISLVAFPFSS